MIKRMKMIDRLRDKMISLNKRKFQMKNGKEKLFPKR